MLGCCLEKTGRQVGQVRHPLMDLARTLVTANDAVYGHKNDVFPVHAIIILNKTRVSRSKCRCQFTHIFKLVSKNYVSHMFQPAEKPHLKITELRILQCIKLTVYVHSYVVMFDFFSCSDRNSSIHITES